jgi:hypothetical protein
LVCAAHSESSNILTKHNIGMQFSDEPFAVRPQAALLALDAGRFASDADVLAREARADGIDFDSVGSQSSCGEFTDVLVADDIGPVLSQDRPAEGVSLAEGDGSHPCSLKPEAKAADSAEEVKYIHAS